MDRDYFLYMLCCFETALLFLAINVKPICYVALSRVFYFAPKTLTSYVVACHFTGDTDRNCKIHFGGYEENSVSVLGFSVHFRK